MKNTFIQMTAVIPLTVGILMFAQATSDSFSISINPSQQTVKVGLDIPIEITLQNTSDHEIAITASPGRTSAEFWYRVDVRGAHGEPVNATELGLRLEGHGHGPIRATKIFEPIGPGETRTDQILLNKLYRFDRPGNYLVQVSRRSMDEKSRITSNTVTITVTN